MTVASPATSNPRLRRVAARSLAVLLGIFVLAAVVAAIAWGAAANTLEYELAKIAMQVVAVAVLGGLATAATTYFHDSRMQQSAERDADAEKRRRQDDLLRDLLDQTLTAYNRVKRIRRLLGAYTADGAGRITVALYDEHMSALIDQQLEFEKFKRRSPFIDDERLRSTVLSSSSLLTDGYGKIEKYLNLVVGEYEANRHMLIAHRGRLPVCRLAELAGFIGRAFVPGAADRLDEVIGTLQKAVAQPIRSA
jgi:hypothetical protein